MRQAQDQGTGADLPKTDAAGSGSTNAGIAPANTAVGATQVGAQGTVTNSDSAKKEESAAEQLARQIQSDKDYKALQAEYTRTRQREKLSQTDNSALSAEVQSLRQQINQLVLSTQQAPASTGGYEGGYGEMDDAAVREISQMKQTLGQTLARLEAAENKAEVARQAAEFALKNDQALQVTNQASQNRDQVRAMFPNLARDTEDYLVDMVNRGDAVAAMRAGILAQQTVLDQAKQESQRQYQSQQDLAGGASASRQTKEEAPLNLDAITKFADRDQRMGEYLRQKIERVSNLKFT